MTDRLRLAWQQILTGLLPALATYVRWEFRVTSVNPGPPVLISATPVSSECPFGQSGGISNITLWPGPSGAYAVPAIGSLVLLEFHEGNPAKPSIAGLDPNVPPTPITLGSGTDPIAMSALVSTELGKIAATLATGSNSGGPVVFADPYTPGPVASTLPVVSQ